jgi:hypothetical protein
LVSQYQSWFRDPFVVSFFDRLIDDGALDTFEQVVFYGSGSNGYTVAAYSASAPMSKVLIILPQATLDPKKQAGTAIFCDKGAKISHHVLSMHPI